MSDNKEQCRSEFEAWCRKNGKDDHDMQRCAPYATTITGSEYSWGDIEAQWKAFQAGRAAQPVVLTDEQPDYELHCNGEFAAGASGKNAHLDILHYAAQYAQDGEIEIFKVTRAKIDPAILAAKEQANGI